MKLYLCKYEGSYEGAMVLVRAESAEDAELRAQKAMFPSLGLCYWAVHEVRARGKRARVLASLSFG